MIWRVFWVFYLYFVTKTAVCASKNSSKREWKLFENLRFWQKTQYFLCNLWSHIKHCDRHKFRSPSYQVQEGDCINIDVTSPGATLALGLMFFRSGNQRVASWLEAPESRYLRCNNITKTWIQISRQNWNDFKTQILAIRRWFD